MQHKKFYLCFSILLSSLFGAKAQDSLNVDWSVAGKKITAGQYELHLKGIIKPQWHMYTKDGQAEGLEGIKISFSNSGIHQQGQLQIIGNAKIITDKIFENKQLQVAEDSIELVQQINFASTIPSKFKCILSYNVANKEAFLPEEQKLSVEMETGTGISTRNRILISSIDLKNPVSSCGGTGSNEKGLLKLFLLGFVAGLLALITPCVIPMIPLTVSFFTKKAHNKKKGISNAVLYGLFIFLIYVALSLPFHFLDIKNPEILNNISTNVYLNIAFFLIFIFFAFSFFGYYEITLPGSFSDKADSRAGASNIAGIFFMALTLALVSFSCTGPILGSLLAGSLTANGGAMQLSFGMGGFGFALALPFALFALFPNWLKALPKSGGWLTTVKVVLGFLELGLAFKFLSNADLVMHWGLLKREIFIGIWILIGIATTAYLLGKMKFPHDSPVIKLSRTRIAFIFLFAAFTLYLTPGLTNTKWANLSLISGFPPPLYYSGYQQKSDCVLGLNCSKDYEEGLEIAKAANKPILLDFTGYACVNCRRMEENVWSQSDIFKIMKERFIVISLYVDDKASLPAAGQFTYTTKDGVEKDIVSIGDKWATLETENFHNNAQPLYAIISTNEVLLNNPVGYTPDANEYKKWLLCGLETFEKKQK